MGRLHKGKIRGNRRSLMGQSQRRNARRSRPDGNRLDGSRPLGCRPHRSQGADLTGAKLNKLTKGPSARQCGSSQNRDSGRKKVRGVPKIKKTLATASRFGGGVAFTHQVTLTQIQSASFWRIPCSRRGGLIRLKRSVSVWPLAPCACSGTGRPFM